MLNKAETYYWSGQAAGKSRRIGDEARAQFERSWLTKALGLEAPTDRALARSHWDAGYRAGAKR